MPATLIFALTLGLIASSSGQSAQVDRSATPRELQPAGHVFVISRLVAVDCPPQSACHGVTGSVHVQVTVDPQGVPTQVKATAGDSRLMHPVEAAVRQYRFRFLVPQTGDYHMGFTLTVPPQISGPQISTPR